MKTLCCLAALLAAAPCAALAAGAYADLYGGAEAAPPSAPAPVPPAPSQREAEQYLPPANGEPGFAWPSAARLKGAEEAGHFVRTGPGAVLLVDSAYETGAGACLLAPETRYETASKPSFRGDYLKVDLLAAPEGCQSRSGYLPLPRVLATSAGGACDLPPTVRAFLDTLAYSEGTDWHYDYIYTFVEFESYSAHPGRRICSGGLCSTAAGRYQFLTKTWDALAADLGLADFSPPNQDKACLEVIRRAGAYNQVLAGYKYENFSAAVSKLNRIWASLPGSPYGQPTHSKAELWKAYKAALLGYK